MDPFIFLLSRLPVSLLPEICLTSFLLPFPCASPPTCLEMYLRHSAGPERFCVVFLGCWGSRDGSLLFMTPARQKPARVHVGPSCSILVGSGCSCGMVGQGDSSSGDLGDILPKHGEFHVSLLKYSFPNRSSCFAHWWNFSI